jgi:hypothetical protein
LINLRERSHLKDLGIGGTAILKWILEKQSGKGERGVHGPDSTGSEQGPTVDTVNIIRSHPNLQKQGWNFWTS